MPLFLLALSSEQRGTLWPWQQLSMQWLFVRWQLLLFAWALLALVQAILPSLVQARRPPLGRLRRHSFVPSPAPDLLLLQQSLALPMVSRDRTLHCSPWAAPRTKA